MCNLSENSRYRILCKLYKRYKTALKVVKSYDMTTCTINIKLHEMDDIMQSIERFPISWKYYSRQQFRFSPDFENLIIFSYE